MVKTVTRSPGGLKVTRRVVRLPAGQMKSSKPKPGQKAPPIRNTY